MDRLAAADGERGDGEVPETRGTGDVKQRQNRSKKKVCLKASKDSRGGRKSLPEGTKTSKSKRS